MADSHRNVKLNARVSPSKKQEWLDALDDEQTLSSLVRDAVDHELSNEYVHVSTLEEVSGQAGGDVDFSEVTERLDDLQGTVELLHREMDALASTGSSYDTERISEVAMDLMDHIPSWFTPDLGEEIPITYRRDKLGAAEDAIRDDLHNSRELEIDGSVDTLAGEVGESAVLVRQALIYLEQQTTADIGSVIVDGTRHWVQL